MRVQLLTLLALLLCPLLQDFASADDGQTRPSATETELRVWLENMFWHHGYSMSEICQVTGLEDQLVRSRLKAFQISDETRPARSDSQLLMLPYPGGRHPRIGFLEGAVEPQRETKLSVFCPWDDRSYVVMDVPEAIWSNLGLTYLAHSHVKTIWDLQNTQLDPQEWEKTGEGCYRLYRELPNGIAFTTEAIAFEDHISMTMSLTNGTDQLLSDLRVQNCVMLKGAEGFQQQTNDNKQFTEGYAIASSSDGTRWIISGWDPVDRAWGNPPCPCLHSDPKFPDCDPGETQHLKGWLSFFQGTDIAAEVERIEATHWRNPVAGKLGR